MEEIKLASVKFKADYNKIFNSDIIIDLLKVLGCGVEVKSKHQIWKTNGKRI